MCCSKVHMLIFWMVRKNFLRTKNHKSKQVKKGKSHFLANGAHTSLKNGIFSHSTQYVYVYIPGLWVNPVQKQQNYLRFLLNMYFFTVLSKKKKPWKFEGQKMWPPFWHISVFHVVAVGFSGGTILSKCVTIVCWYMVRKARFQQAVVWRNISGIVFELYYYEPLSTIQFWTIEKLWKLCDNFLYSTL